MSEWNCFKCKLNFKEKPTYTTTCPNCQNGLIMESNPLFKYSDEEKVDSKCCPFCGEKIQRKRDTFKLNKAIIYEHEPYIKKSKLIHKSCYKKIQIENYEEIQENKEFFKKLFEKEVRK